MIKKTYPTFADDVAEQAFLDTADLNQYDLETGFRPLANWLADAEAARKDTSPDRSSGARAISRRDGGGGGGLEPAKGF